MARVAAAMAGMDGDLNTIDGVRVDWEDGWLLVRPSETSPYMKVSAEAFEQSRLDILMAQGTVLVREAMR